VGALEGDDVAVAGQHDACHPHRAILSGKARYDVLGHRRTGQYLEAVHLALPGHPNPDLVERPNLGVAALGQHLIYAAGDVTRLHDLGALDDIPWVVAVVKLVRDTIKESPPLA